MAGWNERVIVYFLFLEASAGSVSVCKQRVCGGNSWHSVIGLLCHEFPNILQREDVVCVCVCREGGIIAKKKRENNNNNKWLWKLHFCCSGFGRHIFAATRCSEHLQERLCPTGVFQLVASVRVVRKVESEMCWRCFLVSAHLGSRVELCHKYLPGFSVRCSEVASFCC